jgi:LmbE family N-acetylglucosaminyl deacetylase
MVDSALMESTASPRPVTAGFEAFDEAQRIIVVGAHPDDLEACAGGTIARLVARGCTVISVNCTLGDIGAQEGTILRTALATQRLNETDEAGRLLGLELTLNLGHHDGELEPSLELRAQLARLYRIHQPDTLFTFDPWSPNQIHPDHVAAGRAALDAYMPSKMPLYRPEQLREPGAALGRLKQVFLFNSHMPDVIVDVTETHAQKAAALVAHRSQFPEGETNLEWLREWDGETGKPYGLTYAEGFRKMMVW